MLRETAPWRGADVRRGFDLNELNIDPLSASRSPRRVGHPARRRSILTVRAVEFVLVIASGLVSIGLLVAPEASSDVVYSRIVFVAAIAFAVLAETVGSYDVEAQFSLRKAWQRVATAWVTTTLFLLTLGFPAQDLRRGVARMGVRLVRPRRQPC